MFKKDDKTYYDWIDYGYDMKQVKDFEFYNKMIHSPDWLQNFLGRLD